MSEKEARNITTAIRARDYYFGSAFIYFINEHISYKPFMVEETAESALYRMAVDDGDFFLFVKHTEKTRVLQKGQKNGSLAWEFQFTENDRKTIEKYIDGDIDFNILIVCSEDKFFNTRFLLIEKDVYESLADKDHVTFRLDRGKGGNFRKSFTIVTSDGDKDIRCDSLRTKMLDRSKKQDAAST